MQKLQCEFRWGFDGALYAVFDNNVDSSDYAKLLYGNPYAVHHFWGYENAVCLQSTLGM